MRADVGGCVSYNYKHNIRLCRNQYETVSFWIIPVTDIIGKQVMDV